MNTVHLDNSRNLYRSINVSDSAVEKILSFADLPQGWHYGSGSPAGQKAILSALSVYSILRIHGTEHIEFFPEQEGGILVSGYHNGEILDILCLPDGRLNLVHEIADIEATELNCTDFSAAKKYIERLGWQSKKSYGLFTQNTTARMRSDSRVLHSEIHPMEVDYQSLTVNALEVLVVLYANISEVITTQKPLVTHQYSGESKHINFQKISDLSTTTPTGTNVIIM